jgi:hypothetical protein
MIKFSSFLVVYKRVLIFGMSMAMLRPRKTFLRELPTMSRRELRVWRKESSFGQILSRQVYSTSMSYSSFTIRYLVVLLS